MTEIATLITNYGLSVVLSGLFIYQYFKAQKYNEQREEKLYALVDQLSQELPALKREIEQTKDDIIDAIEKGGVTHG